jgi:hypothetical protein
MRALLALPVIAILLAAGITASLFVSRNTSHTGEPARTVTAEKIPDSPGEGSAPPSLFDAQDAATIRRLLDGGADVNRRNASGETALMDAAFEGNIEKVRILIAAGADLAAETPDYRDIFEFAVDETIRKMLLAAGAKDPNEGVDSADPLPRDGGEPWKVVLLFLDAIQRDDEVKFRSVIAARSREVYDGPAEYRDRYPATASFLRGTTNGKRAIVYGDFKTPDGPRELYVYLTFEGGAWKIISHSAPEKEPGAGNETVYGYK